MYSPDCLGPVAPPSWKSTPEGHNFEVTEWLLDRVTAPEGHQVDRLDSALRVPVSPCPSRAKPAPMWKYIRLGDQSVVADGHLLEESLTWVAWMVLGQRWGSRQ
jgi:hypothetical protein